MSSTIAVQRKAYDSAAPWKGRSLDDKEMFNIERALRETRDRMGQFYTPNQVLGRRETIGCVALEITQRCNLDCTLCYLSENSENTKDIPIEKVFERIDNIERTYGPGTAVQITGGDPTMRNRRELVAIVEYTRKKGLVPALFTNGIKASRDLLRELASVGLNDVAFHVDLTQERKGYKTERDLNAVRQEYIDRARGLPITVMFNTTVCDQNFHEIPDIVKFFVQNADVVRMCSFQMQADTGRGEQRKRAPLVTLPSVRNQISQGAGTEIAWDVILFGHHECNRYAPTYVVNGRVFNVIDDQQLFSDFLEDFKHIIIDRRDNLFKIAWPFITAAAKKPIWYWRAIKYGFSKIWAAKWDLLKTRGDFNKVSFFIHNFMDADNLVCERVDTCSFMVMTEEGPLSMCAHNARRDEFITKPMQVKTAEGVRMFDPLIDPALRPTSRQKDDAYLGAKHPTSQHRNHSACGTNSGCGSNKTANVKASANV
jgi:molybdenum cofactor biosynthesis enzyme MoaA